MKKYALICMLCLVLAGCGARAGSRGASSAMHPKEVEQRLILAESHTINRQYQLALQELIKVEPVADHMSRFHFDAGMIYLGLDEPEKSREAFARAVEIDANFAEAWNNLGRVLELLGQDAQAEAAYRRALDILTYVTPDIAATNLGTLLLRQGRTSEAETFARKALTRNWRYIPAYKLLSDVFVAQNRMDEAEAVLKSGLEADMNSTSTMLALAEHQVRIGKSSEAKDLFERIAKQYPKSSEAKVARDYLDLLQ